MLTEALRVRILKAQQNEITEHIIYHRLSCCMVKDKNRAAVIEKISQDELSHYNFWKKLTGQDVKPDRGKILYFTWLSKLFGLTFGLKLLERGEESAQDVYAQLQDVAPEVRKIIEDEEAHENKLIDLINEDKLMYVSSVVLGLNDAIVEFTGALAGFSLALQNARMVAMVGLITGIAASLSMAAAEYLSTKEEETKKDPLKASIYTGIAYCITVALLVGPYLFLKNVFVCLALVIAAALFVIFIFSYYISVAKDISFKKRFLQMAAISLSVAAVNFLLGLGVRKWFGING